MESTPFREDPLPSYLENTKSTTYRWQQDTTDSTTHPSVGDNTTREDEIDKGPQPRSTDCLPVEDQITHIDRVKQLAALLDDLDASVKSSQVRTTDLHNRFLSSSPPDSPAQRESQQSILPSQQVRLSRLSDDEELLSDLDEMINNVPSDEEPDPTMSPLPPPPV